MYPRRVRADMGAENVHVETIRKFLRRIHGDEHASEKILLYGKSINNQRIESLWGIIRRHGIQFWMHFSKNLLKMVSMTEQEISRFCFLRLVQVAFQFTSC